jgi:hypothetical protein
MDSFWSQLWIPVGHAAPPNFTEHHKFNLIVYEHMGVNLLTTHSVATRSRTQKCTKLLCNGHRKIILYSFKSPKERQHKPWGQRLVLPMNMLPFILHQTGCSPLTSKVVPRIWNTMFGASPRQGTLYARLGNTGAALRLYLGLRQLVWNYIRRRSIPRLRLPEH